MQGRPKGLRYYDFMRALHQQVLFDWYLEIGCRQGASFAPVRSKTIAVDPFFKAEINIIGTKPALHIFQETSDAFFDGGFMQRLGIQLGASFLDGMHLFEYLIRDFRNTEAATHPDGVIMMHDCVPFTQAMTTRDLKNLPKGAWTGDVWKIIPILQRWRPDLTLTVLDCRPTGVLCASNLDPGNRVLWDDYDRIVAEFLNVEFEDFGMEHFLNSFRYTSAQQVVDGGFQLFQPVAIDASRALNPKRVTK